MNHQTIKVKTLPHFQGELPKYATSGASGMDVRAAISEPVVLESLERKLIPTGLIFEIPQGYEIQVRPRSGLALKHGISMVNTPGTIDADYRGEIGIILINLSRDTFIVQPQERIAQLVLAPVAFADLQLSEVNESARGSGGFGSTGRS